MKLAIVDKQLSLSEIVGQMGLSVSNMPPMFSELFSKNKKSVGVPVGKLKGLSRVIGGAMPENIDYRYNSAADLTESIVEAENVRSCAAFKKDFFDLVIPFMPMAIAWVICDRHPEVDLYDDLQEIRKIIHANKEVCKISAKGSHRGPRKDEVSKAVNLKLTADGVIQIPVKTFTAIYEYLAMRAIVRSDQNAVMIFKKLHHKDEQQLLLT